MDGDKLAIVMMFGCLALALVLLLVGVTMSAARGARAQERGAAAQERAVGVWEELLRVLEGSPSGPRPLAPNYPPFKPGECAADAQRYYEEHGYVPAKAEPGKAPESARYERWGRPCSEDGSCIDVEATLPSRKLMSDADRTTMLPNDDAPPARHGIRGGMS